MAAPCRAQTAAKDDLHHPSETTIAQGYVGDAWADEESQHKLGVFSFRVLLPLEIERSAGHSAVMLGSSVPDTDCSQWLRP
jgi:hypothetical protein